MTYALGIDLGTTYTAAAVARNGRAEVAALGYRATSVPSVVLLTEDGRFLVGDAAERRAANEPHRVAREFKRRVGDTTPLMLGGSPVAVDRCLAEVLRWVTKTIGENEGGPPGSVTVTHPANWGEFKQDVLREALRLAELPQARLLAEPVAAATWYAQTERLAPGHVVAVYDLGGGTFDVAILRRSADGGFENLGRAEGIERLGGIDVDQAVLGHVLRALGEDGARFANAEDDPATLAALAQLKRACVEAKEALSSETSVTIPVWLPGLHHEVLMRRTELEELVEPLLNPTVEALGRVVRSSGLRATDVHSVLLVGGSSRIPLIARQVSAGFGRPIAVDAHPKHPVALGAALDALEHLPAAAPSAPTAPATPGPAVAAPGIAAAAPGLSHATVGNGAPLAAAAPTAQEPWRSAPAPGGPPRPYVPPPPPMPHSVGSSGDTGRLLAGVGITALVILMSVFAFVALRPSDDSPDAETASDSNLPDEIDLPEGAAEAEGELDPESEDTGDSGPVDIINGDASPAFNAFAAIYDGAPVVVAELVLYPDGYAIISVQTPENPEYFDDYIWEGGEVAVRRDETLIPPDAEAIAQEGVLFDLTELDYTIIPGLVQESVPLCPGEGMEVSHIVIHNFAASGEQPTINVYISNPDRTGTGGYVEFTFAGELVRNACE